MTAISHVSEDILKFSVGKAAVVTTEYSILFFFLLNNRKIYLTIPLTQTIRSAMMGKITGVFVFVWKSQYKNISFTLPDNRLKTSSCDNQV